MSGAGGGAGAGRALRAGLPDVREGARMRPTFTRALPWPRDDAVTRLRAALADDPGLVGRWQGKGRWAEIHVPGPQRRLWSPHLSLRLDEEGGETRLFGRFAPHPEVWTFFMFLYVGIAFLGVFGGVLGWVQHASGEAAWGLRGFWLGVPALLLIHLASWVGQGLGQEQMAGLAADLHRVLDRAAASSPSETTERVGG